MVPYASIRQWSTETPAVMTMPKSGLSAPLPFPAAPPIYNDFSAMKDGMAIGMNPYLMGYHTGVIGSSAMPTIVAPSSHGHSSRNAKKGTSHQPRDADLLEEFDKGIGRVRKCEFEEEEGGQHA